MPIRKRRSRSQSPSSTIRLPSYRQRTGYDQAIVTLTDSKTRLRRDYWLGEYDTPESRERYHRVIAEWERLGRRLPSPDFDAPPMQRSDEVMVVEVIREYWDWAVEYYRPNHAGSLHGALKLLREFYGRTLASEFGPRKLRLLRNHMISGKGTCHKSWSRKYINYQVQRIRHVFKWAAARELVPASVHQALCTLEPLKRGRTAARENPKVGPAPAHLIAGVKPLLPEPVRAVMELQLLTGARPGELLGLRTCDIEIDEELDVWTYRPIEHKNAYRERERVLYFGPQAQEILREFMNDRPTSAYLFSPEEALDQRRQQRHAERRTPLSCGNRPGTNRKASPKNKPGNRYTTPSYCRSIKYACERAFPPTGCLAKLDGETNADWRTRLESEGLWEELKDWRKSHSFHPHQLRHNAATELRKAYGLEAAQLTLGHASANITDAVYAERDRARVIEIMRQIG